MSKQMMKPVKVLLIAILLTVMVFALRACQVSRMEPPTPPPVVVVLA